MYSDNKFITTTDGLATDSFYTVLFLYFSNIQVVAKGMIERGNGGSIVNISSAGTSVAVKDLTSYSSSKGALDVLTKGMAIELAPHKVPWCDLLYTSYQAM